MGVAEWIQLGLLVVAVVGIVIPSLASLINGYNMRKMKELEILTARKLDMFEHYIGCVTLACKARILPEDSHYYSNTVLIYAPTSVQKDILVLNERLEKGMFKGNEDLITAISKALRP